MPTFIDLLKNILIFNLKNYSSPQQEGKRKTISATLKIFVKYCCSKRRTISTDHEEKLLTDT